MHLFYYHYLSTSFTFHYLCLTLKGKNTRHLFMYVAGKSDISHIPDGSIELFVGAACVYCGLSLPFSNA